MSFFGDIWDGIFGSEEETVTLPGASMMPQYWQWGADAQTAAYWEYIKNFQAAHTTRLNEVRASHADELSRYDGAEAQIQADLASLKAQLGAQRDTAYSDIQAEFTQQNTQIEDMADEARGTQEVQDARRGMFGSTAHDSKIAGHDKREGEAKTELNEWRGRERSNVDNQYNSSLVAAQSNSTSQLNQISANRADADRALAIMEESINQQFPVQMDASWQIANQLNMNLAGYHPSQYEYVTDPGQPGLFGSLLNSTVGALGGAVGTGLGQYAGNYMSGWANEWLPQPGGTNTDMPVYG
jgi:hypothetical protein